MPPGRCVCEGLFAPERGFRLCEKRSSSQVERISNGSAISETRCAGLFRSELSADDVDGFLMLHCVFDVI